MGDDTERWLPIPGWEHYEVSDLGRVRSLDHMVVTKGGAQKLQRGKVLTPTVARTGYLRLTLYAGGSEPVRQRQRSMHVHILVLEAFTGRRPVPPPGHKRMEGRHLDGNRLNNRLTNLAWGTSSENSQDAILHGTFHFRPAKTHCPQGHPYSGDNLRFRLNPDGSIRQRVCRTCRDTASLKAYRQRRRSLGL